MSPVRSLISSPVSMNWGGVLAASARPTLSPTYDPASETLPASSQRLLIHRLFQAQALPQRRAPSHRSAWLGPMLSGLLVLTSGMASAGCGAGTRRTRPEPAQPSALRDLFRSSASQSLALGDLFASDSSGSSGSLGLSELFGSQGSPQTEQAPPPPELSNIQIASRETITIPPGRTVQGRNRFQSVYEMKQSIVRMIQPVLMFYPDEVRELLRSSPEQSFSFGISLRYRSLSEISATIFMRPQDPQALTADMARTLMGSLRATLLPYQSGAAIDVDITYHDGRMAIRPTYY